MASSKKTSVEVGDGHFPGKVPGPDGNTSLVTGKASVDYTYTVTNKSIDWDTTLRVSAIDNGRILQNVGDVMSLAGYGLTMSVVGAEVGIPLANIGSGISMTGSLLEAAATADYTQGGFAVGSKILDVTLKQTLKRNPYLGGTVIGNNLIRQTQGLSLSALEKTVNGGF